MRRRQRIGNKEKRREREDGCAKREIVWWFRLTHAREAIRQTH